MHHKVVEKPMHVYFTLKWNSFIYLMSLSIIDLFSHVATDPTLVLIHFFQRINLLLWHNLLNILFSLLFSEMIFCHYCIINYIHNMYILENIMVLLYCLKKLWCHIFIYDNKNPFLLKCLIFFSEPGLIPNL